MYVCVCVCAKREKLNQTIVFIADTPTFIGIHVEVHCNNVRYKILHGIISSSYTSTFRANEWISSSKSCVCIFLPTLPFKDSFHG